MAKKKSKSKKSPLKKYLIGIILLVLILGAGLLFKGNPLLQEVENYIHSKQQIAEFLGEELQISYQNRPYFLDPEKTYQLQANITGTQSQGKLSLTAKKQNDTWHLSQIRLTLPNKSVPLSPLYIDHKRFYAASLSSAPLNEPVFLAGEDIYFEVFLHGVNPKSQNLALNESLAIFDENKQLIASKKNIARYQKDPSSPELPRVRFTNKLGDLPPGPYHVLLKFHDQNESILESHWQKIYIRPSKSQLFVKSVEYFKDAELSQKMTPEFQASQNIYLRLALDGFREKNKKIAGIVDLKIQNSMGELIANKPKFAHFTNDYQQDRQVTIDGKLQLKEPDVYLLSFKIRDAMGTQRIVHQEKVLVTMKP